jgi:hypothetical protein
MAHTFAAQLEQFTCQAGVLAEGDGCSLVPAATREVQVWAEADFATEPPMGIVVEVLSTTCVLVQMTGTTPDLWSGLTRGAIYYADDAGAIATTGTVVVGVAPTESALTLQMG